MSIKHTSCLRFNESDLWRYSSWGRSLTAVVKARMGAGARVVTGPGQLVYGVAEDGTTKKLPSWVQSMNTHDRNDIW